MKVTLYPYGPDVQSHYEELRAAGVSDAEASDQSRHIETEWPRDLRLPVAGDSLSVGWAQGTVTGVSFSLGPDGEWYVTIKLGLP